MRRPGLSGSFWPTDHQQLLLRAALLPPEQAVPSWLEARKTLDIDVLERGSYSLMPLVYRRLSESLTDEPLLPRLKGIYRHTWSKNQVVLDDLRGTLRTLVGAGVETLVVGGAARLQHYPDPGLRTMTEFELACRPADVERVLRAVGWRDEQGVPPRVLRGRSSVRVEPRAGRPFGLHWRLLPEFPAGDDKDFRQSARTFSLDDVAAPALASTDELLHVCAGARSALWGDVQWVPDAVMILRTGEVDWDRLIRLTESVRAAVRLRETLGYLTQLLAQPVPATFLSRLEGFPATKRDLLADRLSGTGGAVAGELPRTLARYIRSSNGATPLRAALGLPGYLRDAWGIESAWRLPPEAMRKAVVNIAERARRGRGH